MSRKSREESKQIRRTETGRLSRREVLVLAGTVSFVQILGSVMPTDTIGTLSPGYGGHGYGAGEYGGEL